MAQMMRIGYHTISMTCCQFGRFANDILPIWTGFQEYVASLDRFSLRYCQFRQAFIDMLPVRTGFH